MELLQIENVGPVFQNDKDFQNDDHIIKLNLGCF